MDSCEGLHIFLRKNEHAYDLNEPLANWANCQRVKNGGEYIMNNNEQKENRITHESAASYNKDGVFIGKTTGGWGEDVKNQTAESEVRPHLES